MESNTRPSSSKLNLSVDLRLLCFVLLAIIIAMFLIWRPWQSTPTASSRTIEVNGQATVKSEPDEYVFYPTYTFTNASRQESVDAASAKSSEVIQKLKEIGLTDKQIKSNTNGYDNRYPGMPAPTQNEATYSLTITATATSREQAQKVQDYLSTTAPTGSVSPQASFSSAKRKQLENTARDQATRDARTKADQSAKNLGFTVHTVKSVNDGAGFNGGIPFIRTEQDAAASTRAAAPSLNVQPGENNLDYSVTVVYYIK